MDLVDTNEDAKSAPKLRRTRRKHSPEFKARVVRACAQPGASVAGVALAHGVNANLVRRWCSARQRSMAPKAAASALVPVTITAAAVKPASAARRTDIIELDVFGVRVIVRPGVDAEALRSVVQILRETLGR